jgi:hypothetical protein
MLDIHQNPHEQWVDVGCITEEEGIPAANPLARVRPKLLQSMTWSSASLGLGRRLRELREPLRERFESMGDDGN